MGVPHFYSWLVKRYPLVKQVYEGDHIPYTDFFYLDLNGVIYKCVKDESTAFKDLIQSKKFDDIWGLVFNYVNKIVNMINPKKVLFIALDGVCPRAKMNQQRSRRVLSAKGSNELTQALLKCGISFESQDFKNNSITPGTQFMYLLNKAMKFMITKKIEEDETWRSRKTVFSGSDFQGEGEHKILDYIRKLKQQPDFDKNLSHCIYSADADLIMLGLTTHLPNISIFRETVDFRSKVNKAAKRTIDPPKFEFLYINIIRQYMDLEYSQYLKGKMKYLKYDLDRIIDDFILLCFYIGNDFLPRIYCFDIKTGNLEKLIQMFKDFLINSESYLHDNGNINYKALEVLMFKISQFELTFMGDKLKLSQSLKTELKDKKQKEAGSYEDSDDEEFNQRNAETFEIDDIPIEQIQNDQLKSDNIQKIPQMTYNADGIIEKEQDFLSKFIHLYSQDGIAGKSFYYEQKLKFDTTNIDDIIKIRNLICNYLQGLQFVLLYYYQGCPSWTWFFNFYYSPLTSDLYEYLKHENAIQPVNFIFEKSEPLKPYMQLLVALPPQSAELLPTPFAKLLTDTENSLLRAPFDYYPNNFSVDPYGAVFESEYIVILPFVETKTLLQAYHSVDIKQLTEEESDRNTLKPCLEYIWDPKFSPVNIPSFLPNVYQDTEVNVQITKFFLEGNEENDKFWLQHSRDFIIKQPKQFLVYPDLDILKGSFEIQQCSITQREKTQQKVNLCFKNIVLEDYSKLFNKTIWIDYPQQTKVKIIGVLTQDNLYSNQNIQYLKDQYGYTKESHFKVFQLLKNVQQDYYHTNGIIFEDLNAFLIVKVPIDVNRKSNGKLRFNSLEEIVPLSLIMTTKKIEYISDIDNYNSIQEEFPVLSNVVVFLSQYKGALATVNSYDNSQKQTNINITINKLPLQTSNHLQKQGRKAILDITYYSINLVAEKLELTMHQLLTIMGSFVIRKDTDQPESAKLPEKVDMGLNLISIHQGLVVPELIRSNQGYQQRMSRYKYFEYIDLSHEAVELITEYKLQHPEIFKAIQKKVKYNSLIKNLTFDVNKIYSEDKSPNISLVKAYVWLMSQSTSNLLLCPLNSQVIPREKIKILENLINEYSKLEKDQTQINLEIDPNYMFRDICDKWIPPFYNTDPGHHLVSDRVINIRTRGNNNHIPFGSVGTIVGVLHEQFEVVFDKPFIGGNSLCGRCSWGKGAMVSHRDVYNLTYEQQGLLQPRFNNKTEGGWDGKLGYFVPKFDRREVSDEYQLMKQAYNNSNPFAKIDIINQNQQKNVNQIDQKQIKNNNQQRNNQNNNYQNNKNNNYDQNNQKQYGNQMQQVKQDLQITSESIKKQLQLPINKKQEQPQKQEQNQIKENQNSSKDGEQIMQELIKTQSADLQKNVQQMNEIANKATKLEDLEKKTIQQKKEEKESIEHMDDDKKIDWIEKKIGNSMFKILKKSDQDQKSNQ